MRTFDNCVAIALADIPDFRFLTKFLVSTTVPGRSIKHCRMLSCVIVSATAFPSKGSDSSAEGQRSDHPVTLVE